MPDSITNEEVQIVRTLVFAKLQDLKNEIDEHYPHDDELFAYLLKRHAKIEMLHKKLQVENLMPQ